MSYPIYLDDDDEAVRDGLSLLLRTIGLEVHAFASPERFLAQLPGLSPGCLILDIRMPVISGLKLQEQLGAYRRGETPCIKRHNMFWKNDCKNNTICGSAANITWMCY